MNDKPPHPICRRRQNRRAPLRRPPFPIAREQSLRPPAMTVGNKRNSVRPRLPRGDKLPDQPCRRRPNRRRRRIIARRTELLEAKSIVGRLENIEIGEIAAAPDGDVGFAVAVVIRRCKTVARLSELHAVIRLRRGRRTPNARRLSDKPGSVAESRKIGASVAVEIRIGILIDAGDESFVEPNHDIISRAAAESGLNCVDRREIIGGRGIGRANYADDINSSAVKDVARIVEGETGIAAAEIREKFQTAVSVDFAVKIIKKRAAAVAGLEGVQNQQIRRSCRTADKDIAARVERAETRFGSVAAEVCRISETAVVRIDARENGIGRAAAVCGLNGVRRSRIAACAGRTLREMSVREKRRAAGFIARAADVGGVFELIAGAVKKREGVGRAAAESRLTRARSRFEIVGGRRIRRGQSTAFTEITVGGEGGQQCSGFIARAAEVSRNFNCAGRRELGQIIIGRAAAESDLYGVCRNRKNRSRRDVARNDERTIGKAKHIKRRGCAGVRAAAAEIGRKGKAAVGVNSRTENVLRAAAERALRGVDGREIARSRRAADVVVNRLRRVVNIRRKTDFIAAAAEVSCAA